ncbi:MAG TPA: hypothetical protein VFQ45_18675 [Longimicrobium sp.]|nr:hypothetical protein [Longimicrobium sp.]
MAAGRIAAFAAALLAAGGCAAKASGAGAAPAAGWTRPEDHAPWVMSGVSPTDISIEFALTEDFVELTREHCPFRVLRCSDSNDGQEHRLLSVDDVACAPVAQFRDRCTFRLSEELPGRRPVRSRCRADFGIVGTSHYPSRWAVDRDDESGRPIITCRRTR